MIFTGSDGTEAGTILLLPGLYYDAFPVAVGNTVSLPIAITATEPSYGKLDGTVAGTTIVKIFTRVQTVPPPIASLYLMAISILAHMTAPIQLYSFWRSNGTEAGTIKLSTVTPYTQNVLITINTSVFPIIHCTLPLPTL